MAAHHGPEDEEDEPKPRLTTAQKFMKMLREYMLDGHGPGSCRKWAVEEMGVPEEIFNAIYHDIRISWKGPATTVESMLEARDLARARYTDVYHRARNQGRLNEALRAIDSLVELDGLAVPSTLLLGAADDGNGQITNSAREKVSLLMERMKELAEKKARDQKLLEVAVEAMEHKAATNPFGNSGASTLTKTIAVNDKGEIEGVYPTHLETELKKRNG